MTKLDDDTAREILGFWLGALEGAYAFDEQAAPRWFLKDAAFDEEIRRRFGALLEDAEQRRLEEQSASPRQRLAHIILLDQLSRNAYRDTARMYAGDDIALALVKDALAGQVEPALGVVERMFLYMPLMHSEVLADQRECVRRFTELLAGLPDDQREAPLGKMIAQALHFARLHEDIVERFGRFPHRNEILGRESTAAEREFLTQPNSSF